MMICDQSFVVPEKGLKWSGFSNSYMDVYFRLPLLAILSSQGSSMHIPSYQTLEGGGRHIHPAANTLRLPKCRGEPAMRDAVTVA